MLRCVLFTDLNFRFYLEKFQPDRILIETSYVLPHTLILRIHSYIRGSAFPATLAFQIRELERETSGSIKLDAIVTVIDAENFIGYEDSSPTAKMQASYTDVILIVRHRYSFFTSNY